MSCGFFTPGGAYDSVWDSVRPMIGNYVINYFQYQRSLGVFAMLNDWITCNDDFLPRQLQLLPGLS